MRRFVLRTRALVALLPAVLAVLLGLVGGFGLWFVAGLPAHAADPNAGSGASGGGDIWGAQHFPNVTLTDQDGRRVRFFDDLIQGKVVSINFVFTSCAASCNLETARMREVQRLLGDRVGRDIHFYSITIDPLTDTPEVLKAYAKRFDVGPGWRFLTGSPKDIELLRRSLGLYDDSDVGRNPNDHSLHGMIGNQATGRWMRSSPFENPNITATQIGTWLTDGSRGANVANDYSRAPKVQPLAAGETLFRTRCSACHTVDGSENLPGIAALHRIGPDLHGVTARRDRAWLVRWLKEPDRVLADKDPLALALFEKYNRVAMPNVRLTEPDVKAMLDFLAEVGARPVDLARLARQ